MPGQYFVIAQCHAIKIATPFLARKRAVFYCTTTDNVPSRDVIRAEMAT